MNELLADFKKFLVRGNLVTLAVAFVIGKVFADLVQALVRDLVNPIIAMIFGKPDFSSLNFTINSSTFSYGDFLNYAIAFVATAAALYFFVVKPYDVFEESRKTGAEPDVKDCPECTSEIPIKAKRCPQCTAVLAG